MLPEHAGEPEKNWLLSCSEKALAVFEPVPVSSFDYGDYTQVAVQSHLFYPAWSDNSDSTGTNPDGRLHQVDLYAALVHIP